VTEVAGMAGVTEVAGVAGVTTRNAIINMVIINLIPITIFNINIGINSLTSISSRT
jgi:hypothetical protein